MNICSASWQSFSDKDYYTQYPLIIIGAIKINVKIYNTILFAKMLMLLRYNVKNIIIVDPHCVTYNHAIVVWRLKAYSDTNLRWQVKFGVYTYQMADSLSSYKAISQPGKVLQLLRNERGTIAWRRSHGVLMIGFVDNTFNGRVFCDKLHKS